MTVYVKKQTRSGLESDAIEMPLVPSRGTTEAAGYDVRAFLPYPMMIKPLETVKVPTGLFFAIPSDSAMLICSRSGLASKGVMVANGPGILDSDYRGELLVLLTYVAPPDALPFVIRDGDRIAQLLFVRSESLGYPRFFVTDALPAPNSNRVGGFGSTGR